MATKYPNSTDNDSTLPRVDDNLTEIGGEAINSVRDATLALEKSVGTNPQGNKSSLTERVNVSIDANGNLKTAALAAKGVITLPIYDHHVATDAAIKESKLDLDYSTASLRGSITSLSADMTNLQSSSGGLATSYNNHIFGIADFHDGYAIRLNAEAAPIQYGIGGMKATTVGDALNEIGVRLFSGTPSQSITPHLDLDLPSTTKHQATGISVSTANFNVIDATVQNVQEAFDSLDQQQGALAGKHLDSFHSNGIMKEIKSGDLYNDQQVLVSGKAAAYAADLSVVTLTTTGTLVSLGVQAGDILVVSGSDVDDGVYQIKAVGPIIAGEQMGSGALTAYQVEVYHVFTEASTVSTVASVYRPESMSSQLAPLACAVRHNETIVDTISILNPNAARVVSLGFNGAILNDDAIDWNMCIEVGLDNSMVRGLTIPNLNYHRLGPDQPDPVDAQTVAERINAFVSHPDYGHHFPITAFRVGNELAIAHNLVGPKYTLRVLDGDGYAANYALGLDALGADVLGKTLKGNLSNSYVVGGTEASTIRTAFSGTVTITSDTDTFTIKDSENNTINPLEYGLGAGSVMHVTGHPQLDVNGSYTLITATTTTVSTFAIEPIPAPTNPTTFSVLFTDANRSLAELDAGSLQGVLQVAINKDAETQLHQRLVYGTDLLSGFEIIDVSETLPAGDYTLNAAVSAGNATFSFIDDAALSGDTVTVKQDFTGRFRLYHSNNQDYLVIRITETVPGILAGTTVVTVRDPVVYDESMVLCNAHFNSNHTISSLFDTRPVGNMAADQIRDDFVEVFSQRPVQDLRSNGVVRGFDLVDLPFSDRTTGLPALPLSGGVAYVAGVRVAVVTQKAIIQPNDSGGTPITGDRIVGINEFGSIQAYSDTLEEILTEGFESSTTYGKVLPLYRVTLTAGVLSAYEDLRLHIDRVDDKLDLVVDASPYNFMGSFKSISGALEYVSLFPSGERTVIKVVGEVTSDIPLVVPAGVVLCGSSAQGGGKQRILNTGVQGSFITLEGNNRLENLAIENDTASLAGSLVEVTGSGVSIDSCYFNFGFTITTQSSDYAILVTSAATDGIRVRNNLVGNCFSGIVCLSGMDSVELTNNRITGSCGATLGVPAYGIRVESINQAAGTVIISNNTIVIPTPAADANLMGIAVSVDNNIRLVRITDNEVVHLGGVTGSSGISVYSEGLTGNTAKELIVTGNSINGLKLNGNNVWGIYVGDCETVTLAHNHITNLGVSGKTDVGGIALISGVEHVTITNNTLKDFEANYGIYVDEAGAKVKITDNSMYSLGTSATYIGGGVSGDASYSIIANNTMIGPGTTGINWSGTYSKIANNKLNLPGTITDNYAFSAYGIYVATGDVDIDGNTVLGMNYDEGSVGISNANAANANVRITNNTVSGTLMAELIDLNGSGHVVANNRLYNVAEIITGTTTFIRLNAVSYSVASNNLMTGAGTYGFASMDAGVASTQTTAVTFVGNQFNTVLSGGCFNLYDTDITSTQYCTFLGNQLPYDGVGVSASVLGKASDVTDRNTNTVGVNPGLTSSISIPSVVFAGDMVLSNISWSFVSGGNYIVTRSLAYPADRYLYMPITGLISGAQIYSIDLFGSRVNGTWTLTLNRFNNTSFATTEIGTIATLATVGDFTYTLTASEIVDNAQGNLFAVLKLGADATSTSNIVYGLRVNFRY
jgi:hypothetical protein